MTMANQNYGISSKWEVHPLCHAPNIPPHKPPSFSLLAVPHCINSPLPRRTYKTTAYTLAHIHPLSNPVILYSFHIAQPNTPWKISSSLLSSLHTAPLFRHSVLHLLSQYPAGLLRLEICLWLSLQLKGIRGKIYFLSFLSEALFLFYCSSFHDMMHADPMVKGGGNNE